MTYFTAHFNVDDPLFRQEMIKNSKILFPSETEENGKLRKVLDYWVELAGQPREYTTTDRFRLQATLFELFGILSQIVCPAQDQDRMKASPLLPFSMPKQLLRPSKHPSIHILRWTKKR